MELFTTKSGGTYMELYATILTLTLFLKTIIVFSYTCCKTKDWIVSKLN